MDTMMQGNQVMLDVYKGNGTSLMKGVNKGPLEHKLSLKRCPKGVQKEQF